MTRKGRIKMAKPTDKNPSLVRLRLALWGLVVIALAVLAWFTLIQPRLQAQNAAFGPMDLGHGEYALQTTDGAAFTEDTLKGQPSAVFFGFTHCPDVCPTTLGDILSWQEQLGEGGKDLRVYFVTVDPERDTPEVLGDYVSWVPGVQGVTGSVEETQKALKAFRIFARKVPSEDGESYSMDHSAMVLLFDAQGNFSGLIGYQEAPEKALATLNRLLS